MRTIGISVVVALVAAACGGGGGGNPDGGNPDGGQPNDGSNNDGGNGNTCGQATLFAGNPFFGEAGHDPNGGDSPAQRPADGANMLTGIPYHYQLLHFGGSQILTNDQLSVWSIDASNSVLHVVAGDLTANAQLKAGPCASARFADVLGSALGSDGTLYLADYANAILKVSNPLNPSTCTVSYFAGTATDLPTPALDGSDGSSGTNDGTGSAAQFLGPQWLTIDGSSNLYVLDGAATSDNAWSIRKITPGAVVTTIATFTGSQYAYGELQYLNGKVYFWARGNDMSSLDTANLIVVDPSVTSPVANPTFHPHTPWHGPERRLDQRLQRRRHHHRRHQAVRRRQLAAVQHRRERQHPQDQHPVGWRGRQQVRPAERPRLRLDGQLRPDRRPLGHPGRAALAR